MKGRFISEERLPKDSIEHIILRHGPIWEMSDHPKPHERVIAVYKQGVNNLRDLAIFAGVTIETAKKILTAEMGLSITGNSIPPFAK